MMPRDQYMAWCKARAHEYIAIGDIRGAVQSMMSDVQKRADLNVAPEVLALGFDVMLANDREQARRFIDGFN